MNFISGINLVIAFLVECISLFTLSYLVYSLFDQTLFKIIAGLVALMVLIFIWGALFSPKAGYRLEMPWIFIGKFILLLGPSYYYLSNNQLLSGLFWAVLILVHLSLAVYYQNI